MFGPKELDIRNTYNPNLQDIEESARRTYGEANSFFRKEELYLKDVESRIKSGELSLEQDIYDECHAIASDLAKCCEMYLKALYIFEHNIPGSQINLIWDKLKNSEFKTDEKGNLIYLTSNGILTFPKYNTSGEIEYDEKGKMIYIDREGNIYSENNRGSKIKRNGHQLDRLIELLSPESRLLLETRMLTIPMSTTEKNQRISVLDLLQKKGILSSKQQISSEQYSGWLEQHKKTFEEARYSGQKKYDVSVEFLYHLATQIKAVVQYKIEPQQNQIFKITDEELSKLPMEIQRLSSMDSMILSEQLIKLVVNNQEIRDKLIKIISQNYIVYLNGIKSNNFYQLLNNFDLNEITYISYLCYILKNYKKFLDINEDKYVTRDNIKKILPIVGVFKLYNFSVNEIVEFCLLAKEQINMSINNQSLLTLFDILNIDKFYKLYKFNFNDPKQPMNDFVYDSKYAYNIINNYKYDINDKHGK
ncbi:MAG: hypothetical protein IJ068_02045 [Bacilli bacterium]|nr:hypothetical protein [Bacilli bacterium]